MLSRNRFTALSHVKPRTGAISLIGILAMLMANISPSSAASHDYEKGEGFHVETYYVDNFQSAGGNQLDYLDFPTLAREGCATYSKATFNMVLPLEANGSATLVTVDLGFRASTNNAADDGYWFEGPSGTYKDNVVGGVNTFNPAPDPTPPPAPPSSDDPGCLIDRNGDDPITVDYDFINVVGDSLNCQYTNIGINESNEEGTIARQAGWTYVIDTPAIQDLPMESQYTITFPCGAGGPTYTLTADVAAVDHSGAVPAITPPCAPAIMSVSCTLHQGTLNV